MARCLLTIIFCGILIGVGHGAGATGPEEVVDAFHEALHTGDKETALQLMSPEVIIFESGGAEMSRDTYEAHHLAGDLAFSAASTRRIEERVARTFGDVSLILTRSMTTHEKDGAILVSPGVETMILRRGDHGWHIEHIHWSSGKAKPLDAGG